MKLYYIPFDIQKTLNIINDAEQYVIDDIVRFHIIVVSSNMDEYKNNKSFLSNADRISLLPTIIGKYASTINDANFVQCYNNTDIHLKDGFWDMINKYKVYQRISPEVFAAFLSGKVNPYPVSYTHLLEQQLNKYHFMKLETTYRKATAEEIQEWKEFQIKIRQEHPELSLIHI